MSADAVSFSAASAEAFSDLRWRLAANVKTTTFKFGDHLVAKFFQRFLARGISHRCETILKIVLLFGPSACATLCLKSIAAFRRVIDLALCDTLLA